MSRSPLSRWFVALVVATVLAFLGVGGPAPTARADDKPGNAVMVIADVLFCFGMGVDELTKSSVEPAVPGQAPWSITTTKQLLSPEPNPSCPTTPAGATDAYLFAKSVSDSNLRCADNPPAGLCDVIAAKLTPPDLTPGAPFPEFCFGEVGSSIPPPDLPVSDVKAVIAASPDHGGDHFMQVCFVNNMLTPAASFIVPPEGSGEAAQPLDIPAQAAFDPATGVIVLAHPLQPFQFGDRIEIFTFDASGEKTTLNTFVQGDSDGPAANAGLSTELLGTDGKPVAWWQPPSDSNLQTRLDRLKPANLPKFPASGLPFFSGSSGGTGRPDAAVDEIRLVDPVGYQGTPTDDATPWSCAAAPGVVCASDQPLPVGNVFVVSATVAEPVPLSGPDFLVYDLAFDSDGKTNNNKQPSTDFPNDPLQGTDVTYEVHYEPSIDRWSLVASDSRKGPTLNNKTSVAQAVISGSTITWFIPANELDSPAPNFRVATTIGDADLSMAPDTTAVDASPGGPDVGWSRLQPMDVTDLASLNAPIGPEPSKPTVTGGCITVTPGGADPAVVPTHWHVVVRGTAKVPTAAVEIGLRTRAGTTKISGITLNNEVIDFPTAFPPATYTVSAVTLVPSKGKRVDVTKSFQAVFGKTLKVTPTSASSFGPDC